MPINTGDRSPAFSGWNYCDVRAGRDGGADRRRDLYAVLVSGRPAPVWAAVFFIIINAVNLANVRLYPAKRVPFALIKVLAIIGMIAFGLWMLFGGHGGSKAGFDNLWKTRRLPCHRLAMGLILSLAVIRPLLRRLELIGITAAEAQNPEKSIPKAVNQGGSSYPVVLISVRWWCCWRSTRGWRSNPTAARL
ncbi:hypothetical protein MJ575_08160 [Klebsiella pneumoniae]|nr:hypothetical protein MJ575_08160 [Klebsiella pneumoniae]